MLDLEKMTFLTREQLREQAPTVFALKPSSEVSKKYTHIPTLKVVEDVLAVDTAAEAFVEAVLEVLIAVLAFCIAEV